ncbi:MAG: T9SS type A sorting domain-containing protein [Bacteroidetes bacterium]|nr:T9SS type A sorting domain-containing protein [Bacteroidota bacterium]
MKYSILLVSLVSLISLHSTVIQAQSEFIQWQRSFGGSGSDQANSISQTSDGGYIVAGHSISNDGDVTGNHGGEDYWVIKLDNTGTLIWQKSLGGSVFERANSINETNDGGYIVSGHSVSNNGDVSGNHGASDYWVVKLDAAGTLIWQKSLGSSGLDVANSIIQTTDNGYIVAGYSQVNDGDVTGNHGSDDFWVVKLDSVGTLIWQKSLGGSDFDIANSIIQTNDGGYIVAGYSSSNDGDVTGNNGGEDYWVVKLDTAGTLIWQKSLGGSVGDEANSIIQTADNGYIVAGASNSVDGDLTGNHGSLDYWVAKLDTTGMIIWQKSLGGSGFDGANSLIQTTDNGYIVAGTSQSNDGDVTGNNGASDFWVVKLTCFPLDTTNICLVTVDSQANSNIVVWEKTNIFDAVDSFRIYRDIGGTYTHIGSVHRDSLSLFEDTKQGVNPKISSYRYRIAIIHSCGHESVLGPRHVTMHLQSDNTGLLNWDHYEGFNFNHYRIWRDITGSDNFVLIDSVTNANSTYTDLNLPSPGTTVSYMIEVVPASACVATRAQDYTRSISNTSTTTIGMIEMTNNTFQVSVFPNPNGGRLTLRIKSNHQTDLSMTLYRIDGKMVLTKEISANGSFEKQLDLSKHAKGIYYLQLVSEKGVIIKKVVYQ